jgi:hypothetical protein
MKRYTYRVVSYVDVVADSEEQAKENAEEMFEDPSEVELYEVDDVDMDFSDIFNEERKLNEESFNPGR